MCLEIALWVRKGSLNGRSLQSDGSSVMVFRCQKGKMRRVHTMNHVVYCVGIVLTEVDDASLCFAEWIGTSTIEESGPGADDCSVYGIFLFTAKDCKI